jgi:predicted transcriptional regulator
VRDVKPTETSPLCSPKLLLKTPPTIPCDIRQRKSGTTIAKSCSSPLQVAQRKASIAEVLKEAKVTCKDCHPSTPMICVTRCSIWKLKNEIRELDRTMKNPNFVTNLLNTLKNKRRLQILEILLNGRYSAVRLQQELKKLGYYHSRHTIAQEYVNPLIEVGLVQENHSKYHATVFGCKFNELMKDFSEIEQLLPPHSECYEEKTIRTLFESPKTYEELKFLIPTESLSRVLKRLNVTNLITKNDGNNYVFYFKTKRNSQQEKLSPTEKRVYRNIPEEGITAKELASKTNISLRRTYKYLRKLRGKKLTFKRKRPKTYALTKEGTQVARLLEEMHILLIDFAQASAESKTKPLEVIQQIPVPGIPKNRSE